MGQPLSSEALDTIFRNARTYNHYIDKPLTEAEIRAIWELMKFGPTSTNSQPARLVWCISPEAKETLAALSTGSNGEKIRKAPATVIIGMDLDFHETLIDVFPHAPDAKSWFADSEGRKINALRNSSLQGAYFIIAARALGLDTGPMSGFDNDAVDKAFFADTPNIKSNFIATLGYGDAALLHPRGPRHAFDTVNRLA